MTKATLKLSKPVREARRHLRRMGWTQTAVAVEAGVSREHLTKVLNGYRESRRLIEFIMTLDENPDPA